MTSDDLFEFPYLTRDEFAQSIEHFVHQYAGVLAGGHATSVEIRPGHGSRQYLRICKPLFSACTDHAAEDSDAASVGDLEDPDPVQPEPARTVDQGQVEYHIVHLASWRVPVLYVRVHVRGVDGSMETVMDAGRVADALVADRAVRGAMAAVEFGGALGIQDHPELGEPFMYLHPCHTATLLRAVVAPAGGQPSGVHIGQHNFIAAWLSLVGTAVGLTLPSI
ncbi:E2-like conjugating enzyme atg10 [Coemansia sp. RSA 2706]|nr:E2-like conjugating enzyme atg10 [Coemansia sp. RSA 2706]KAJ2313184.1 E2-like conjugating enzyme atg10 [Coemansia sp. RSA 2705]KAJ2320377.1 E2-like conjugating enzyme atg10 [Coemansia sp. RSA 2704]KAJ2738203.1 E2-like conjugating enzyme atg10 [Coemansia sp. Cherry 401B]